MWMQLTNGMKNYKRVPNNLDEVYIKFIIEVDHEMWGTNFHGSIVDNKLTSISHGFINIQSPYTKIVSFFI